MKIGLFFGSFNPINTGHLIIANTMVECTDMDKVWFVVSPQNPHKINESTLLPVSDRFLMVKKAIAGNNKLDLTDIEFNMPRPSYTIDTLLLLKENYQEHTFFLIIGEDNLQNFDKWKDYNTIIENYGIYVYPRIKSVVERRSNSIINHLPRQSRNKSSFINLIEAPILDISSTLIRQYIKEKKSIKYLVTKEVEAYLMQKKM